MRADFRAILDACVLANARLCDLLLRLAETPRLYLPYWSGPLLDEAQGTHRKLQWPAGLSESWREAVSHAFPDACLGSLDAYNSPQAINEKDRHVVQAALCAGAEDIVTFNLRDFPSEHLEPLGISAKHPSEFLINLLSIEPLIVSRRLEDIAKQKGEPLTESLRKLAVHVPDFVEYYARASAVDLED